MAVVRCPASDVASSAERLDRPLVRSRPHPTRQQSVRAVSVCHSKQSSRPGFRQLHPGRRPEPTVRQRHHTADLWILPELEVVSRAGSTLFQSRTSCDELSAGNRISRPPFVGKILRNVPLITQYEVTNRTAMKVAFLSFVFDTCT